MLSSIPHISGEFFLLRSPQPRPLLTHRLFSRLFRNQKDHHSHMQPFSSRLFTAFPRGLHLSLPSGSGRDLHSRLQEPSSPLARFCAQQLEDLRQWRDISPLIFSKPVVVSPGWKGLQAVDIRLEVRTSRAAERSRDRTVLTCL